MAGPGDQEDRTEQATAKREQDARDQGQVARSRELSTMFLLFGGGAVLYLSGGSLMNGLAQAMSANFSLPRAVIFNDAAGPQRLVEVIMHALVALAPLLLAAAVLALVAPLALGGWVLSSDAFVPKFSRLNPWQGLSRVFGMKGILEMLKALAKFVLIMALLVLALKREQSALLALGRGDIGVSLAATGRILFEVFCIVSAATVVLALIDVPLQLWQHAKQLRMSKQELREESKETDGSPEMKGRIRAMQQEVARRRMMEQIPKADVIVTNPEHYAVALRFDPATMRAPVVLAKGIDDVARNIRAIAAQHRIQTVEAPPLARAIYHTTKINREIPAGLYVAVARVLAYVFQLRAGARDLVQPVDLPIPQEMSF